MIGEYWQGLAASWHGFRHMCRNPWLWVYTLQCIGVIGIVYAILVGLLITVMVYYSELTQSIGGWKTWAVIVLLVFTAVVLFLLLPTALRGYFYGKLAEKVAIQLGMDPDQIQSIAWWHWAKDTTLEMTILTLINLGLMAFGCVPVVGAIVSTVGFYYINSFVLGREYLDFPLDLHGMRRQEKLAFARRHRAGTLGLGTVVVFFYFLPVINLVLFATCATGAVMLHHQLDAADRSDPTTPPVRRDLT